MIQFNLKKELVISILLVVSLIFIGCEGCSRYGVKEHVVKDGSKFSSPEIDLTEQVNPEDNNKITSNSNLTLQQLYKKYSSAVFLIYTSDTENTWQGSGFFMSSDGIGVSNYHVFKGTNKGSEVIKLASGEELKISEIIAVNEENDYIIFKVNSSEKLNYFKIATDFSEIGDEVFAIGNPKGLEHTLSKGIISGYRGENKKLIQTTTEITHGSSGGPLLNMNGDVIGITTSGLGEADLNFAVNIHNLPIENYIKKKSIEVINKNLKTSSLAYFPTSTTGQIIKHAYFTVSYSEKDEQPEWVAYKITESSINNHIARTNDYRVDPYVKSGSASPYDYSDSGYDMGHLAPAKTMSKNLTSMSESFYLSNICPQTPSFNRGIWKRLEDKIRYWSAMNDSIYEATGPILEHPIGHIGKNNVTVPRAFYKALLRFKNGKVKGIGFIMPNEKSDKGIYSYAVAIDEIERITGIDFYYELDKSIQEPVEKNKDLKNWITNQ